MNRTPSFCSLRELDSFVEREIAKYLDVHFYPLFFDVFLRVNDVNEQLKGKDMTASSVKLGLFNAIIDEKSDSHYVNQGLPTFAFELSFNRRNGELAEGWFVDDNKPTEYYLIIWPKARPDNVHYLQFNGKDYPFFRNEDITELDFVLVNRDRLRSFVEERGYSKEWLGKTAWKIRNSSADWFVGFNKKYRPIRGVYFFHSVDLDEKPVNLIIYKRDLESIAILKGKC